MKKHNTHLRYKKKIAPEAFDFIWQKVFFWKKKPKRITDIKGEEFDRKKMLQHETKRHVLIKFLLVLLVFVAYFLFVTNKYGLENGALVALLTWSFFVLCTPVADAGFLIDFPLRFITNVRMFMAEILVWLIAINLNVYAFFFRPEVYETTKMLDLFWHILKQPFPFWSIVIVSGFGTFLSVQFGDELFDKAKHKQKKLPQKHAVIYRWVMMIFVFASILILYDFLLKKLGVNVPI
jgi:hypothetical protein